MGGATQPQGHAQIVINLIDFGMNLQEAGDAPRILHNGSSQPTGETMTDGGVLQLESGIDYEVVRKLVLMGHKIMECWFIWRLSGHNVGRSEQSLLWCLRVEKRRTSCRLLDL